MKVIKETRERFGRFFYRFPEGESAADVYDRVSSKVFGLRKFLFLLLDFLFCLVSGIQFVFLKSMRKDKCFCLLDSFNFSGHKVGP